MSFAIETADLSKRYGRTWALANLTIRVPRNSVLLVAGKNGSGKTTLFRVLATAARADAGSARVDGIDLAQRDAVRRRTALLTHHSYLYESLSATENLRAFAQLSGGNGRIVGDLLDQVGLGERMEEPVSAFSAGMRKRLSLARLLLQLENQEVSVVFLDEPYAALDAEGLDLVDKLIRRLHAEGRTVAIASHLLERCALSATHAVLLDAGRLLWSGTPDELLSRHQLLAEGIA